MKVCLFSTVALLLSLPTAQAQSTPPCTPRFQVAFSRLTPLSARRDSDVSVAFGPRQDLCEAGAYQRFLESFLDLAREAMRAPAKGRDAQVRVAIAILGQIPTRVPAEEGRAAGQAYRQVRSDMSAIAEDVKMPVAVRQLLDAFDRAGAPIPESTAQVPPLVTVPPVAPPPAQVQTGPNGQSVQTVRVPSSALPSWAVVNLYEARELLKNRDVLAAKDKLELVLRWMETAP